MKILFQLRQLFKARLEPAPQANGVVRFFCDPTFWAKNVVNLGERGSESLFHVFIRHTLKTIDVLYL